MASVCTLPLRLSLGMFGCPGAGVRSRPPGTRLRSFVVVAWNLAFWVRTPGVTLAMKRTFLLMSTAPAVTNCWYLLSGGRDIRNWATPALHPGVLLPVGHVVFCHTVENGLLTSTLEILFWNNEVW